MAPCHLRYPDRELTMTAPLGRRSQAQCHQVYPDRDSCLFEKRKKHYFIVAVFLRKEKHYFILAVSKKSLISS